MRVRGLASLAVVLNLTQANLVFADDANQAQALFDQGVAAMTAGRFDEACPSLAQSDKLDPKAGTLFTLAECEAKRGRIASAVDDYDAYLKRVGDMNAKQRLNHRDREQKAQAELATLRPQVPELTLALPPKTPEGVRVTRDGQLLAVTALNVATRLDPGAHRITVEAPAAPAVDYNVTLKLGEKRVLLLDGRPEQVAATSAEPATLGPVTPSLVPNPNSDPAVASSSHTLAFVVGGVGIAGLATGAVLGGIALGKKGTIDDHCHDDGAGHSLCDATGKSAADAGRSYAFGSTVAFGVGVGLVATAAGLWVFDKPAASSTGANGAWKPNFAIAPGVMAIRVGRSW